MKQAKKSGEQAGGVARRAVKKHLKEVARYLPLAAEKAEEDDEYVHQLRVESRRAAAALDVYAEFLPHRKAKRLSKQLKKILKAASDARDLDVLAAHLREGGKKSAVLLRLVREDRRKAQKPLEKENRHAHDRHFNHLARDLLDAAKPRAESRAAPFGPWARGRLRPLMREFFAAVPVGMVDARTLHRFRIRGKRLRYAMEMLAGAFPPAFETAHLRAMENLQDRLGSINDLVSEQRRLRQWQAKAGGAAAIALRQRIARNSRRLEKAHAAFRVWCTPQFLRQLRDGLEAML